MARVLWIAVLICAALLQPAQAQAASRFAVLVGVGKYHPASVVEGMAPGGGPGRSIDLKSPPNDLVLMQELLSYYGFDDSNTLVLADTQATRQAIVDSVKSKLLTLPPGSLAVFYYSGHGSAVKSRDGRGESIDETIVPYDGRIGGQAPRDIVDDDIYSWIDELNRNAVTATFIFDSCFSGGIARVGPGLAERKLLPAYVEQSRGDRDGVPTLRTGGVPGRPSAVVILTASDAREPAQGTLFMDRYQGVFTTALHDALLPSEATVPLVKWSEAIERVLAVLRPDPAEKPVQSPRNFGNRDAPIFDSKGPFSNSVGARRTGDGRAVMSAGADVGITEGSVFKLFGASQVPWARSNVFEAKAKVAKVGPTEAELEVVDGRLASETLAAVEVEYAVPGRRIKVALPPRGQIDPFDRAAIVAGLGKFAEIGEGPSDLKVSFAKDQWTLATASGLAIGGSFPDGDSESLTNEVGKRFGDYARWRRLADWKRRGAGAAAQVRYRLSQETPNGLKLIEATDFAKTKIAAGSVLRLMVENREARTVQIDALLLRPNFTIDVCRLGVLERGQELATEPVELGAQEGAAVWKIIVSDPAQQLSFLFLASEGARVASRATLGEEFARVWNGAAAQPRVLTEGQSFWKTLDVPFQVTRAPSASTISAVPKRCLGLAQK
jgi:hypothetical protein